VPYYDLYETADGKHMSVGALEPQFYAEFVRLLGIEDTAPDRYDAEQADALRKLIAETFRQRTQAEWVEVFEGTDACVAGILPLTEAAEHPHMKARGTLVQHDGYLQPAPAPRFSRTGATIGRRAESAGDSTREALAAWGVDDVDALIASGAAVQA
jgi:alpha-methylacyl-CoA racemase